VDERRATPALAAVGGGVVLAALLGVTVGFWAGGLVLAGVLAGCALARLALPTSSLGPLAVRSRAVDVVTAGLLAAALGGLALVAPGGLLAVLGLTG
jgi:hypothetical protein